MITNVSQRPAQSVVLQQTVSKTTNANNTTASIALWRVTGVVRILKLYGVVTTVLGANHTAAHFRLNDQTAQVDITLNTGTTLSAAAVGTFLGKTDTVTQALTAQTSAAGRVHEQQTSRPDLHEFVVVKKNGANTDIEYRYSTTDAPTSGVIQFFVHYEPLSADGALAVQ